MNFGSLHYFLGIKTIKNDLKITTQCWAEIGLWLQWQLGSLPCATGRKAAWATAWRPASCARAGRAAA
jgi:hypothetical protein